MSGNKKTQGLTLIELMLALVITSAAILGVFKMLDASRLTASIESEAARADILINTISAEFGSAAGRFGDVRLDTVLASSSLPAQFKTGAVLANGFGGTITPASHRVRVDNDAFALTYDSLDQAQCLRFLQAVTARTSSAEVETSTGTFVVVQPLASTAGPAQDGRLDGGALADACATPTFKAGVGRVRLIVYDGRQNAASALPPNACACTPGQTEKALNPCPVGQVGAVTQSRNGACTGGTSACPTNEWSTWVTLSNTCAPISSPAPANPSVPPPSVVCVPSTRTQTLDCPVGEIGTVTEAQTSACASPNGSPLWSGAWVETSRSCQKPVGPCRDQSIDKSEACPLGMTGAIASQKAYTCDAAGVLQAPRPDVWTVTANTCVWAVPTACAQETPKMSLEVGVGRAPAGTYAGITQAASSTGGPPLTASATSAWPDDGSVEQAINALIKVTVTFNGDERSVIQQCNGTPGTPSCAILSSFSVGGGVFDYALKADYRVQGGTGTGLANANLNALDLSACAAYSPAETDLGSGCFSGSRGSLMGGGMGQEDFHCSKCLQHAPDGTSCLACGGELRKVYCQ